MEGYYVYGVNSMGTTWYLWDKRAKECNLWSTAPKELRAVYKDIQEAKNKASELNNIHRFGSTRHYIEKTQ